MNIFDPNTHIQSIVIVGCGGTGAQTSRIVARIVYDMQRAGLHAPRITLVDPDTVEEKNVGRQLFTAADAVLGLPKAEVVARRLNMALGLDIAWIAEPISAEKHFDRYGAQLIVSCVDNHLARRELHHVSGVLIGAGNHRDGGQVVIGNTADTEMMRQHIDGRNGKYRYLPKEGLLFPALLEPEPPSATREPNASCAELVQRSEQDVLINDFMACVVGQYVYALLHRQPIRTFASFISLDGMSVRSLPICKAELEMYFRAMDTTNDPCSGSHWSDSAMDTVSSSVLAIGEATRRW